MTALRVGIVAPSSAVGRVELAIGVHRLRDAGLDVTVHPSCHNLHYTFAGTDAERAGALLAYANDPDVDAIWCAGGGYGATRLLPILAASPRPSARKLIVGYSDVTALHAFVGERWNWSTLHFPMPSASNFNLIDSAHFNAAIDLVNHVRPGVSPWSPPNLRFLTPPPERPLRGVLVGGNLSLWTALACTPYAPARPPGRLVFFEDIGEAPYRIDRMAVQLEQAGAFNGASAIVLGDFTNGEDEVSRVLAEAGSSHKVPLRPTITTDQALAETFGRIARQKGIALAVGLPVGHGPRYAPLPLGAEYELTPDGELRLLAWDWLAEGT